MSGVWNAQVSACACVYLSDAGSGEGHDDGHDVDRELELQELGDAIVDVSPPHHRLDDAAEVVIGQDDVRRLFGHVCPRDALAEIETERRGLTSHDVIHASVGASKSLGKGDWLGVAPFCLRGLPLGESESQIQAFCLQTDLTFFMGLCRPNSKKVVETVNRMQSSAD